MRLWVNLKLGIKKRDLRLKKKDDDEENTLNEEYLKEKTKSIYSEEATRPNSFKAVVFKLH